MTEASLEPPVENRAAEVIRQQLGTGWRLDRLCGIFGTVLIAQIRHPDAGVETWYTDQDGHFLGNRAHLPEPHVEYLRERAADVITPEITRLLFGVEAVKPEPLLDLLRCDGVVLWDVLGKCGFHIRAPRVLDLGTDPPVVSLRGHEITLGGAGRAVRHDFKRALLDAPEHGLAAPSPVDGTLVENAGALYFGETHYAYRFVDHENALLFYVFAGYSDLTGYAVFIPEADVLIAHPDHGFRAHLAARVLPGWFATALEVYGHRLPAAFAVPPDRFAYVLQGPPWLHIGHQLWNDLTGIDEFLQSGRDPSALSWIVQDGCQPAEIFGAIDDLFPELRGRVVRGVKGYRDLVDHLIDGAMIPLRFTANMVSAGLRARVQDAAKRNASTCFPDVGTTGRRHPVIALGLRMENRTLPDLAGFYALLVHCVLARHPNAAFVIDGRNASGTDRTFASVGQRDDADDLLRAELDLLRQIRALAPGATVVGAVGLPVADNLRLLGRCDYFVSPWGAGLAKYRWVWNMPGFVFTSQWNLAHRSDLRIYDVEACMEAPTRVSWIRPELVFDHVDVPVRVNSSATPEYRNFWIDQTRAIEQILAEVTLLRGEHPRQGGPSSRSAPRFQATGWTPSPAAGISAVMAS